MKELFSERSTNGRWGLAVVGRDDAKLPAQGSLRDVGRVAGMDTYEFVPGETGTWVMVAGDVDVRGGATLVDSEDLQSGRCASLLLLGKEAVVEHYGYKRRHSSVTAYRDGKAVEIPSTVLAAMGLIKVEGATVPV